MIVNSYDTQPTAARFRIFFQLKRASRKPFQIPCVFSMKAPLAFKVTVNFLYVMRSIAPTFLVVSEENAPRSNPAAFVGFTFLVFSGKMRLAVNVPVNSYDTQPTAPEFRIFFQLKRATRKPFQTPCVFSMNVRLAFRSDCEFTCDAASCSLIPKLFPRKTRLAGGIPSWVVTAVANLHSYPSQEESQILTKEHCTGDVGLYDFQFLPNRGSLL